MSSNVWDSALNFVLWALRSFDKTLTMPQRNTRHDRSRNHGQRNPLNTGSFLNAPSISDVRRTLDFSRVENSSSGVPSLDVPSDTTEYFSCFGTSTGTTRSVENGYSRNRSRSRVLPNNSKISCTSQDEGTFLESSCTEQMSSLESSAKQCNNLGRGSQRKQSSFPFRRCSILMMQGGRCRTKSAWKSMKEFASRVFPVANTGRERDKCSKGRRRYSLMKMIRCRFARFSKRTRNAWKREER